MCSHVTRTRDAHAQTAHVRRGRVDRGGPRSDVTKINYASSSYVHARYIRTRTHIQHMHTSQHKLTMQSTVSSSSMGSNKVFVNNHLKISAAPSLATLVFAENAAQIGKSEDGVTSSCLKSKWLRTLEITILTCVILFVCGLFTVPTILFIVPHLQVRYSNLRMNC